MKKKALVFISVVAVILLINSVALAIPGINLISFASNPGSSSNSLFITEQYINPIWNYPIETMVWTSSQDEIYEAVVVGPDGTEYIIIIVNGEVHVMNG